MNSKTTQVLCTTIPLIYYFKTLNIEIFILDIEIRPAIRYLETSFTLFHKVTDNSIKYIFCLLWILLIKEAQHFMDLS